ncbi:hypothetical protein SNK05_002120 [Fusarium graminearum]|uniref:Chromosome 1, complete genome n=2 Tax=Gibberella zeae (strain ATCC MYA-4620 / CBS 123657 / FGSC 9075 / NRRL 31084 / PH-1) TaxID=229533 RepID=A0A1C3YIN2_GIBZE|nr:unnamed protein product [Fusarium graminearum]
MSHQPTAIAMSIPINIPAQPLHRQRSPLDSSPFPEDEGPYMGYTETFENGHIYRAVSSGSGRFVAAGPQSNLPSMSFVVEKERASNMITIKFRSRDLKQVICQVLGHKIVPPLQLALSIDQVLQHYDSLRAELDSLADNHPYDDTTKEMHLLVDDLLLERSLYDGSNMGRLRQQGVVTPTLLRDIHQRNMDLGVNDLEECFQLGEISEEDSNEFLETQNAQIGKFARTGNLDLLSGFCEPLLRSNDIRIIYDAGLLSQILDRGFFDIYVYILDLVERTRSMEGDMPNPDYPDITYDPLCVAIRLGHCPAVRALICNKLDTFEGRIEDAVGHSDRVFTPLLAAILWQQVAVIRLLLREGPLYHSELVKANNFAVEMGFTDILDVLADLPKPKTSAHEAMSAKYPVPRPPQFLPTGRYSPYQRPFFRPSGGNSSISGISSALSGSLQEQMTKTTPTPFMSHPTSPGTSSVTVSSPRGPDFCISPQDLSISQILSPVLSPQFDPPSVLSTQAWLSQDSYSTIHGVIERSMLLEFTRSYKRRSHLGHSSMFRLKQSCRRIKEFCDQRGDVGEYGIIQDHCINPTSVSRSGLNHLRNILRNQAPPGLAPVLQALLVADALIYQLPDSRERDIEFTQDLYRWKVVALERELDRKMFDELVRAIWKTECIPPNTLPASQEDALRFGELARDLVSVTHIKPPDLKPVGTRIRAVQRKIQGCHKGSPNVEMMALPGPESTTARGDSAPDLHVVEPRVVLLLQSVALNVLFATSSAIQDVEDSGSFQHLFGAPASINRSTAIVEDYLSFDGNNYASYDSGIGMETPLEHPMSPWMLAMKDDHMAQESLYQPEEAQDALNLDPALLSFGDNSLMLIEQQETGIFFDDILTPPAQDTATMLSFETQLPQASTQRTEYKDFRATPSNIDWLGERTIPQQECSTRTANMSCPDCGKVLSSKSNLGKHERTACPKKPPIKMPCRFSRSGCDNKSSTGWNKANHERYWCRYNPNRERRT